VIDYIKDHWFEIIVIINAIMGISFLWDIVRANEKIDEIHKHLGLDKEKK
jgi:hypothetical protein